jgi:hypothetical protein
MMIQLPKAQSVTQQGEPDDFVLRPGWSSEATPSGETRMVVSVPPEQLPQVHAALVSALAAPIDVLYRQEIDRKSPRPQGSPPRDFVALGQEPERVIEALQDAALLVYCDARCEVWLRGALGEQIILDHDGLVFCYPDDPSFRDVLTSAGVPDEDVVTMADRDYVKHWFRAEADELELQLIQRLRLTEVKAQR